jgi:hypothetical protein
VKVLANWENSLEMGFHEAPTDLATVAPTFGAAHLFIDDCLDGNVDCYHDNAFVGTIPHAGPTGFCYRWSAWACLPCEPSFDGDIGRTIAHFSGGCNQLYPECDSECYAPHICTAAWNCPA